LFASSCLGKQTVIHFSNRTDVIGYRDSMVRVSIYYPSKPGARFDVDYYLNTHMPLAIGSLGPAIKAVSVDIGMIGGTRGELPPFTAICHFTCESAEAFTSAFLPNADLLQGDIPNFTDIAPVIQVSEIRLSQ
jgi:uncharacterized protein (TIGR02118 family)